MKCYCVDERVLFLLKHAPAILSSLFHLCVSEQWTESRPTLLVLSFVSFHPIIHQHISPLPLCASIYSSFCLISVYNPLIFNSDCFCSIHSPSRAQLSTRQLCLSTLNISRADRRATAQHPSSERWFWIFFLLWSFRLVPLITTEPDPILWTVCGPTFLCSRKMRDASGWRELDRVEVWEE